MSRALPFTVASLARAIKGVELAGRFVVGVRSDGMLIVGDKPFDVASLVPPDAHNAPAFECGHRADNAPSGLARLAGGQILCIQRVRVAGERISARPAELS